MARDTGQVTEVGVGNIQFYIPSTVSADEECVFNPEDAFCVHTIADVGLLLMPADASVSPADILDGLQYDDESEPLPTE
ncbi:hypothetical protein [Haloarcula sediminis]|uniref:hypothetical protein n=1 Tax=Haloarcula sediminis TaxID=3111777 RepID=UPI002D7937B8|nr:hypothetical protein [Haloarcula sp. CK38]